jgi:ribonucleoside-diphosphate reductase alpha chain
MLEAYRTGCKGCTTYRPNDVTGIGVSDRLRGAGQARGRRGRRGRGKGPCGEVIYMSEPLDRPAALEGHTYKLKWPDSEHALYITINDIILRGTGGPSRSSSIPRTWNISRGPWR